MLFICRARNLLLRATQRWLVNSRESFLKGRQKKDSIHKGDKTYSQQL